MAHTQDFIPSRDAEFDDWLANLTSYVEAKVSGGAWTHIPADKAAALKQRNSEWHAAYGKTIAPPPPTHFG
ncbi:MAG: hypothetical protein LBH18_01830 [Spirochaetaceae bacterium]|jgi:hypothetical protein|nr:hypothetical protein [Spirochaetaceae bacterium]